MKPNIDYGAELKRKTFDEWMQAIESLEARKENQRLQDKLRRIKEILEE